MKKLLIAVAVFMCVGTMSFAQEIQQDNQPLVAQVVEDTYKEVKAEDLNAKVQAALNTYKETSTVKKLEYNDAKKLTKVTLEDNSTKAEKVVTLDDEGKEME